MVSGFLISPKDHDRIRSGEAKLILISSKVLTGATGLNGLVESSWFISYLMNGGGGQRGPKFFGEKFWPGKILNENFSIPSPQPRGPRSSPKPRTSLTRTLNDSGTPASKLSSPLTIDS